MSILKKLLALQTELKAPKGQYNTFGKYKYRSCEDILEGIKPLLKSEKVIILLSDKIIQISNRYYVESTATIIDIETGEEKSVTALARESEDKKGMDSSQVTGSTSSYARKYALNGLLCIDDTKDSDTDEEKKIMLNNDKKEKEETEEMKKEIIKELVLLVKKHNIEGEKVSKYINKTFKKNTTNELNIDELDALNDYILGLISND